MSKKKVASVLFKVKSKVNKDSYYTSKDFPEKVIDGKVFMAVKKTPSDKNLFYMQKDMMERVSNE